MKKIASKPAMRSVVEKPAPSDAATEAPPLTPPRTVDVTGQTLLETRSRALNLLAGVGENEGIRLALAARGYDDAAHLAGWNALHAASGFRPQAPIGVSKPPEKVGAARVELDAWDNVNFGVAHHVLQHDHPEAHAAVFAGALAPGEGAESVVRVQTFLDRLDALDRGDSAAAAALATAGITATERARVRGLVAVAQSYTPVNAEQRAKETARVEQHRQESETNLRVLRAWYEKWAGIAKLVISRRDWLITLGLASPRRKKKV